MKVPYQNSRQWQVFWKKLCSCQRNLFLTTVHSIISIPLRTIAKSLSYLLLSTYTCSTNAKSLYLDHRHCTAGLNWWSGPWPAPELLGWPWPFWLWGWWSWRWTGWRCWPNLKKNNLIPFLNTQINDDNYNTKLTWIIKMAREERSFFWPWPFSITFSLWILFLCVWIRRWWGLLPASSLSLIWQSVNIYINFFFIK